MMKPAFIVILCLYLWHTTNAGWSSKEYHALLRGFAIDKVTNPSPPEEFKEQSSGDLPQPAGFPCEIPQTKSPQVPTSVHQLRPSDVNVIAAMGDSITAGNGINASNAVAVLREFRGRSWSIGGDKTIEEGVDTLANVFKKYNPNLKGFSTGYGSQNSEQAWFNVAVPGAKAAALPAQADNLINKLKTDKRIDWKNDWKVITLLIGGNNLCDYCFDRDRHSPETVGKLIKEALDKLHAVVPRAFVNLVTMADITPVPNIRTGIFCNSIHWALCKCAKDSSTKHELKAVQMGYYQQMKTMATSGRYDTRDDFTVVHQPFLVNQDFVLNPVTGKYDKTYIAPDCFHPNWKSHQGLAKLLWNAMITPVTKKIMSTPNDELLKLTYKCPTTESPYFFTNKNSK